MELFLGESLRVGRIFEFDVEEFGPFARREPEGFGRIGCFQWIDGRLVSEFPGDAREVQIRIVEKLGLAPIERYEGDSLDDGVAHALVAPQIGEDVRQLQRHVKVGAGDIHLMRRQAVGVEIDRHEGGTGFRGDEELCSDILLDFHHLPGEILAFFRPVHRAGIKPHSEGKEELKRDIDSQQGTDDQF